MSYFGALVLGAAGVAFVLGVEVLLPESLHPVTAPITSPNSTTRVYILFIGAATLY